jgi:hypothetical protein
LVNWETNTKRHDFSRLVVEGVDMNHLQAARMGGNGNDSLRLDSRVESFCMEVQ